MSRSLLSLAAHFVVYRANGDLGEVDELVGAQGVLFDCPQCGCGHRILVWFANPRGIAPVPAEAQPSPRWRVSGLGLSDLQLSPSINLDVHPAGVVACRWHGHVINGAAQ